MSSCEEITGAFDDLQTVGFRERAQGSCIHWLSRDFSVNWKLSLEDPTAIPFESMIMNAMVSFAGDIIAAYCPFFNICGFLY
ncbi:hypothetical protein D3C86_2110340 [compost metagenome]